MAEPIDFYFDFSSSYSYVALPGVDRLSNELGLSISWKPILLGAVFKSLEHAPPILNTVKGDYIFHDVKRGAKMAGLAFQWPQPFPFNSISAARAYWAIAENDTDLAVKWARAVFNASYGEGRNCSNPETLGKIAVELGLDANDLISACASAPVKEKFQSVTAEAMQRGVFGCPTFFVGDEMFWGSDRLASLEQYIKSI